VQIFDLFDVKKKGVIDFEDFVRSLNVFHPNVSLEDKIACKLIVKSSTQFILNSLLRDLAILIHWVDWYRVSVSFRLYDLRNTGFIERSEVRW